jgi:translocation and assembly module TamB
MGDRQTDDGVTTPEESGGTIVIRRRGWRRVAAISGLVLVILLLALLTALWIARRPIASNILERELDRRGVQATYKLDRVGLRTQQISNLVIGDPKRPDLVAKFAIVQVRITWTGGIEVYRIVARGVRLRGRLVNNKVSWGQIDRLMPPPSKKPFQLPEFVLDVADAGIGLATPYGPLGFAIEGKGRLTGGFKGRVAMTSPRIAPGRCEAVNMHALARVEVVAKHPRFVGPLTMDSFRCPLSSLDMTNARLEVDSRFNESFTDFDGSGRIAMQSMVAGANGLANFVGKLTYAGNTDATFGTIDLSAQKARMATIYAERTHLSGKYRLGITGGTLVMAGRYDANGAKLAPSMLAGVTGLLAGTRGTPVGPVVTSIGNALQKTAGNFDADGEIRVVNFPGGGAARIVTADIHAPTGARARLSNGDGFNYYWWTGGIRIDGLLEMAGGGLPTARVLIRQPRPRGPMNGMARIAPYRAGNARLALSPVRFAAAPDGSTMINTSALIDGPIGDGAVRGLRVPINGRFRSDGAFALGTACGNVGFDYLKTGSLQLGQTRLPVCPIGQAMISKRPGASLQISARTTRPRLVGRLGSSLLSLAAAQGRAVGREFSFDELALRLGRPASPIIFDANRLRGSFGGKGMNGTFAGAKSTIGNVPLLLTDADGKWRVNNGDVTVDGAMTVADRAPDPRFYPLRTNDARITLANGVVRASGSLRHQPSGTLVTNVDIEHVVESARGHATLDVPGLTFGPNLQPEELTRLTEGVIALVNGTIRGQGRIDWNGTKVSSSGDFSTDNLDLAAPFGPVTGMAGTMHFNDLLALSTPPGQVMTVKSINPGILVENGVIRYQLLPNQLVKVERGEWPFMGGRLILRETVLNFSKPTAKRLTFEVVGLDAKIFVDTLGFKEFAATGIFDGVLPMIFDENGGRIVGGRLDSRPGGGSLAYNGVVNKANLGMMGGIAFNALRDLRFRSMVVRLDGDLAGEFTSRLTIEGVGLGQTGTQKIIRGLLRKIPLKLNVTIKGPFRALIATSKSFRDPRTIIGDVLPRPLEDIPGITTEVRRIEEQQQQTQTPPAEQINTAPPPTPSER